MYVCQLSLLQLLIWAGYRHFKERLPEAICCCLQTCNVDVVLLVMYCMYIPGFIVTSADISQLSVYLCYSLIYCLRLFGCCLQTCNVYGTWVTLYCICVQIFMVTCANIS